MNIAFVGVGRMGANMARRLHRAGHHVVAFNRTPDKTEELMAEGLDGAFTLDNFRRLVNDDAFLDPLGLARLALAPWSAAAGLRAPCRRGRRAWRREFGDLAPTRAHPV